LDFAGPGLVVTSNANTNGPWGFTSIKWLLSTFQSCGINSFGGAGGSPGRPPSATPPPVPGTAALIDTRYLPATNPPSRGTAYFPAVTIAPPAVGCPSVG
jgi:hypothetical protein